MRFAEKMEYKIIADEKTKKYQILPLMIQPLVENAIRHGVEKVHKICEIIVKVSVFNGMLHCEVDDNCIIKIIVKHFQQSIK